MTITKKQEKELERIKIWGIDWNKKQRKKDNKNDNEKLVDTKR